MIDSIALLDIFLSVFRGCEISPSENKNPEDKVARPVMERWINWVESYKTVNIETTLSLAKKPEIKAVTMRQFQKPNGANKGGN